MSVRDPESFEQASVDLARRVASVERLVVLLLLAAVPEQSWTHRELAAAARITSTEALAHARVLADQGIVELAHGRARLSPRPEVRRDVAALAALYREHPETVLRALNADALDRLRTAATRISDT